MVDVVTTRRADLHAEVMGLLGRAGDTGLPTGSDLYGAAYRPIVRAGIGLVDVWAEPLAVGRELPTLPLALNAELCLPLDLEATDTAAADRRRLG